MERYGSCEDDDVKAAPNFKTLIVTVNCMYGSPRTNDNAKHMLDAKWDPCGFDREGILCTLIVMSVRRTRVIGNAPRGVLWGHKALLHQSKESSFSCHVAKATTTVPCHTFTVNVTRYVTSLHLSPIDSASAVVKTTNFTSEETALGFFSSSLSYIGTCFLRIILGSCQIIRIHHLVKLHKL